MKRYVKSSKELRKFWITSDLDVYEYNQHADGYNWSTWHNLDLIDDYILAESPKEAWELAKDHIKEKYLQDDEIYVIDSYETHNPEKFIIEYENAQIDSDLWYEATYYNIVIKEEIVTEDGIKEQVELMRL